MTTTRRLSRLLARVGVFVCLLSALAVTAFAQTNKGSIKGTVVDPNNAAVTGATVTVTNIGTNAERTATTGDQGEYEVPLLEPGTYRVTVTAQGFKKTVQENVVVQTGTTAAVDVKLEAGEITGNTVTITAAPDLVQSETSDRGSVVTGREVTELPLSGRNFTQLATLTPGVVRSNNVGVGGGPEARAFNNGDPRSGNGGPGGSNENGSTESSRFSRSGGASLSVNGQRPTNNNFSLDGVDNNEPQFGTIGVFPNPDAIAEFRVTTSVPPADIGRASGAVINTTIKSGTNDFHGSIYYYGQNSALNAYHPVLKRQLAEARARNASQIELDALRKAVQQIHEFGGTIGGPIIRNRTFFFFDYLGQRNHLPFPANSTVPTQLSRQGIFTEFPVRDCNGNGVTDAADGPVCDPRTGTAFPNATIPSNRIAAVGRNYLNAYPLPTRSVFNPSDALTNRNFFTQRNNQERINNYEVKIDHHFTESNSLTGRFNEQRLKTVRANVLPGNIATAGFGAGEEFGNARQVVVTDTHTFSPTLLNEARFGFTQINIAIFNCGVGGACNVSPTFAADIGIPNSNDGTLEASGGALIGNFGTGFLEFTGDGGLFQVQSKNPYIADTVTIIHGSQTYRVGGEARLRYIHTFDGGRAGGVKGQFQYADDLPILGPNPNCPAGSGTSSTSGNTCYVDPNGVPYGGAGNGQAAILLGLPGRFVSKGTVFGGPFNLRAQEIGFFVQDDWKVNDRLTLNLGLRYDLFTPYTEGSGRIANFDLAARQVIVANGSGDRIVETDRNNFGPRLGFAYSVNRERTIVVRGGYGLLYTVDGVDYPPGIRNPPFTNSIGLFQLGPGRPGTFSMVTGPPSVPGPVDPANVPVDVAVFAINPQQRTAYVHQFQASIQWQFARDYSLDFGYVGNRAHNLLYSYDFGRGGTAEARNRAGQFLNNATFYNNGARSQYDGLQIQLQKRYSNNIQGQVSYTFSQTLDNSTGIFNGLGDARGSKNGPLNPFDLNVDWGTSSLDARHLLSADVIIDLPFGKGQRYLNNGGAIDRVFGGWQLNVIELARSGYPFSVTCGNCSFGRPSLVGDPFANLAPGRVLNAAAFSTASSVLESFTNLAGDTIFFGSLPRNSFRGPAIFNTDMSLFKNIALRESMRMQLGIEFFNLFNHANYTVPENNFTSSDFGRLNNALPGRVVQYRLKLLF